jgi:hypothetical protein
MVILILVLDKFSRFFYSVSNGMSFCMHFLNPSAQIFDRIIALVQQANLVYDHVEESTTFLGPGMKWGLDIGALLNCMCKLLEELFSLLIFLKPDGIQLVLDIFSFSC